MAHKRQEGPTQSLYIIFFFMCPLLSYQYVLIHTIRTIRIIRAIRHHPLSGEHRAASSAAGYDRVDAKNKAPFFCLNGRLA